jgi:hypothetical protein
MMMTLDISGCFILSLVYLGNVSWTIELWYYIYKYHL